MAARTTSLASEGGRNSPFFVEELEGVPLAGVVTGRDDHTTAGTFHGNGQFGRRRGSQTDVDHVEAHAHQRTADDLADHLTGDARIAADDRSCDDICGSPLFRASCEAATDLAISTGLSVSPLRPPIVPRNPEIDLIKVILLFILLIALGANLFCHNE